jgi:hypothetical protein
VAGAGAKARLAQAQDLAVEVAALDGIGGTPVRFWILSFIAFAAFSSAAAAGLMLAAASPGAAWDGGNQFVAHGNDFTISFAADLLCPGAAVTELLEALRVLAIAIAICIVLAVILRLF